jgi:DNA-binding transcriptional ArsR family regulator
MTTTRPPATALQGRPSMQTQLPVLDLRMNIPAPDVRDAVAVAVIVGDPIRASIVRMLRDGPVCVCEMAAALGSRENNVSNHLAKLRDAGLVRAGRYEADTRRVYYERDETACRRALDALGEVLG